MVFLDKLREYIRKISLLSFTGVSLFLGVTLYGVFNIVVVVDALFNQTDAILNHSWKDSNTNALILIGCCLTMIYYIIKTKFGVRQRIYRTNRKKSGNNNTQQIAQNNLPKQEKRRSRKRSSSK